MPFAGVEEIRQTHGLSHPKLHMPSNMSNLPVLPNERPKCLYATHTLFRVPFILPCMLLARYALKLTRPLKAPNLKLCIVTTSPMPQRNSMRQPGQHYLNPSKRLNRVSLVVRPTEPDLYYLILVPNVSKIVAVDSSWISALPQGASRSHYGDKVVFSFLWGCFGRSMWAGDAQAGRFRSHIPSSRGILDLSSICVACFPTAIQQAALIKASLSYRYLWLESIQCCHFQRRTNGRMLQIP